MEFTKSPHQNVDGKTEPPKAPGHVPDKELPELPKVNVGGDLSMGNQEQRIQREKQFTIRRTKGLEKELIHHFKADTIRGTVSPVC